ncbi:MAG: Trm112 family protein [bacterium]
MGLDPDLLNKLVCPRCHGPLRVHGRDEGLDCKACGLRYPVERFGEDAYVPDMIIEHAKPIGSDNDNGG